MKEISTSRLVAEGYTEAPEWSHNHGKAYRWPNLVLALVFFGALTGLITEMLSLETAGVVMLVSFASILVLWIFFRHSSPVSPVTGRKLSKYRNCTPHTTGAIVEVVYVDHLAKRFFVQSWLENDRNS